MLDKEKDYNIDEQFAQEAWLKMKRQLDIEMPVQEKKKRRGAFWLWFGATGVVLIALSFWMLQPIANNTPTITEKQNQKIENKEVESFNNNTITSSIPADQTTKETFNEKEVENINPQKSISEKQVKTTYTSNKKKQTEVSKTAQNNNTTTDINAIQQINPLNIFQSSSNHQSVEQKGTFISPVPTDFKQDGSQKLVPSSSETVDEETAEEPIAAVRKSFNINSLSPISLNLISTLEEKDLHLELATQAAKGWFASTINWGGEVGIQSANPSNLNGLFAGLYADLRINPRLFISTGLRYNYSTYERNAGFANSDFLADSSAEIDNSRDTSGIGFDPSTPTTVTDTKSEVYRVLTREAGFHALSMPVVFNYRISPKWSVGTGVHISYLLKGLVSGTDDQTTLNGGLGNYFGTSRNSAFQIAVDRQVVRRWDLGIRTGLNYQLTKGLGLGLHFNAVLFKNKGKLKKSTLQNNELQLSLRYGF